MLFLVLLLHGFNGLNCPEEKEVFYAVINGKIYKRTGNLLEETERAAYCTGEGKPPPLYYHIKGIRMRRL
ncbi:MAG: hypothetical protein CVV49_06640 [Spirochaetae bacterium HGW-Spirochaetae-5]|nr:MAG: hypothetical protein CVV49_06640 [Spirochaetae bacterium HGW-Spirochaetae-5]